MKGRITAALVVSAALCLVPALLCAEGAAGKTTIKRISTTRSLGTSFLIVSKSGTTIVLDPYLPASDVDPAKVDAVFITHSHYDHTNMKFQNAVIKAGKQVVLGRPGEYKIKDITVTGIAASHNGDTIQESYPNDVLYLIEVDGLRIVHMGDIGQTALIPDQLKALGRIDIAMMQFDNSYSSMNVENEKGFKLMAQLNPTVIIPTHTSAPANAKLEGIYGAPRTIQDVWTVAPEDLPAGKTKVVDLK